MTALTDEEKRLVEMVENSSAAMLDNWSLPLVSIIRRLDAELTAARSLYQTLWSKLSPELRAAVESVVKDVEHVRLTQFAGSWTGDDFEKCLKIVEESRGVCNFGGKPAETEGGE